MRDADQELMTRVEPSDFTLELLSNLWFGGDPADDPCIPLTEIPAAMRLKLFVVDDQVSGEAFAHLDFQPCGGTVDYDFNVSGVRSDLPQ